MRALLAAIAAAMLAAEAYATPPRVMLVDEDATHTDVTIPREGTQFDYYLELGESFTIMRVQHAKPDSFRYRFSTQAAIGAEGPWKMLDLQADSPWQTLPMQTDANDVTILLDDGAGAGLFTTEPLPLSGTPSHYPAGEDVVSTVRPERDCLNASGAFDAQAGACYTYRSLDRIEFTGTDGQQYKITIHHAGGC